MLIKKNNNNSQTALINHAVEVLKRGGILVMPTETAYGLAADATNKKAIMKIYEIKGRSFKKFLPLICSSINQIKKYFKLTKKELELLSRYNGLSVILKPKKEIYLLKNQKTCALRISTNNLARLLTKKLGRPITATSANKAGGKNCYSVKEVLAQLKETNIDLILDAGRLKKKKPSTIVEVLDKEVKILRQGEVKIN